MSNYSRGYELENRLVRKLREKGWIAWRSASSKSPVDVVAVDEEGQVHFFQVKKVRSGYFNRRELAKFQKWKTGVCVFKHFWVWKLREGWIFQWDELEFKVEL